MTIHAALVVGGSSGIGTAEDVAGAAFSAREFARTGL